MSQILIVDDDARFRRTLELGLVSFGYRVSGTANGEEAVEAAAASAPDLVVLDWHLPGMDGLQTCRALRVNSDVPVIMVSGNRWNSRAAALDAGASDHLAKPFSINELLTLIECALKV